MYHQQVQRQSAVTTATNIALSSSVGGTSFSWTIASVTGTVTGATASNGPVIAQTLTNSGSTAGTVTYRVTPTANTCPGNPVDIVVTVNPTPDVSTASPTTICSATATNIALVSNVSGATFSWTIGTITGSVSGATASNGTTISQTLYNSGTTPGTVEYIVTPTANSCPGNSSTILVTVNPLTGPTTFTLGSMVVCQDSPDEQYTATAVNSTSILYSVTPAAAGIMNTATGLMDWDPAFYGNVTITATATGSCGTSSSSLTVMVRELPSIVTQPVNSTTCEFGTVNFDVTASGEDISYLWYVDANTGTFVPVTGGNYSGQSSPTLQIWSTTRAMNNYKYHVVVSGCLPDAISDDVVLTVNQAPELTVHPSDLSVCLGEGGTLLADGTGTSLTWQWEVNRNDGNGFVALPADANFSGVTSTTLTITDAQASFNSWMFRAKATGICGAPVNTNFARLSVTNPPNVITQPVDKAICENGETSFIGNGSGYTSMQWQVSADAGATWSDIAIGDPQYLGAVTNQLSVLNAPVTLNGNKYRLALIGSCTTVYTNEITLTVNPNPVVAFASDINACGGIPVVLDGNPSGGTAPYTQHRWTGDVGPLNIYTVQSPTFNSQIPGTYNLNYQVTDSKGCTANDDLAVIVDSPSAVFTQDINGGCTPLDVQFTKADMTGIASFSWDFDDGTPAETAIASPLHTFENSNPTTIGYYNVKLKVQSPGGCIKEYTSLVTVYPAVRPTFTASTDTICSGNTITFTGISGASNYFWDFGDGVNGPMGSNAMHLYMNPGPDPMNLDVKLITTSFYGCMADTTIGIVVMPVPAVQFSANPVSQVYDAGGNPVTFTNLTNAGNWTYLWTFGDGTTSTDVNPSHTYTDLGDYDVTLEVTNGSCSDMVMHTVSVLPPAPIASFDPIPSGCEPCI